MEKKDIHDTNNETTDENAKPIPDKSITKRTFTYKKQNNNKLVKKIKTLLPKSFHHNTTLSEASSEGENENDSSIDESEKVQFLIVPVTGNPFIVQMSLSQTLFELQDLIVTKYNILPEVQQLCISGRDTPIPTDDEDITLKKLGISSGSLIRLSVKMSSGIDNSLLLFRDFENVKLPENFNFSTTNLMLQDMNISPAKKERINNPPKTDSLLNNVSQECKKKCRPGLQFSCKCGGIFCNLHRYYDMHQCTFDYKTYERSILHSKMHIN